MHVIELYRDREKERGTQYWSWAEQSTVSAALDVYYRSSHEYKEFNSHNQKQMPN